MSLMVSNCIKKYSGSSVESDEAMEPNCNVSVANIFQLSVQGKEQNE